MRTILELNNPNYCATIVKIDKVNKLEWCDNLVWINIFGYNIIAHKDINIDEPQVLFTAETQIADEFLKENNLYSSSDLNKDVTKKGYIWKNGRVRAIRLRGHPSNAMLMPVSKLPKKGKWVKVSDRFNIIDGMEIAKKYELPVERVVGQNKVKGQTKKYERIDGKNFPEHFSTEQYLRNEHKYDDSDDIIVTQKLHWTSVRLWYVETKIKPTKMDKLLRREQKTEYDYLAWSRRVIKDLKSDKKFEHYYATHPWELDIYNKALEEVKATIPKDVMYYAEIIWYNGWNSPIQRGYTYNCNDWEFAIYIYRIVSVNKDGRTFDWGWDAMKEFAKVNSLSLVPEMYRCKKSELDVDILMDKNYSIDKIPATVDPVVPLPAWTVDEWICIRREWMQPYVTKVKSPLFYEFETKLLDEWVEVAG